MNPRLKERSPEHPPSPTAPKGAWFRRPRTRVAAGAAVVTLALGTALGPAAAEDLLAPEPATSVVAEVATQAPMTPDPAVVDAAKSAKEPSEHDKRVLVLTMVEHQQETDRFFAAIVARDRAAAEAARQRAAEAAAARPAAPAGPSAPSGGVWDALAACESGGNWGINTGNGYSGGLQFSPSTWRAHGGSGMPHQASRSAQISVAQRVQASQGWGAWPACSRKLGLR